HHARGEGGGSRSRHAAPAALDGTLLHRSELAERAALELVAERSSQHPRPQRRLRDDELIGAGKYAGARSAQADGGEVQTPRVRRDAEGGVVDRVRGVLEPSPGVADGLTRQEGGIRAGLRERMSAVGRAELNVRRVPADAPVVPRAEAELKRRCIGARAADRAVGVAAALAERYAVRPARVAHLRDRVAKVTAGRIQVDQPRGVLLLALVPGGRPLQRQSGHYAAHERSLHALDDEVLAVGVEEDVAGHLGVEESDLD